MLNSVAPERGDRSKVVTGVLVALVVLGLGLAAAPAIFQMFDRAPMGGDMIDAFEPYMTRARIDEFRGFLREMDAASQEAQTKVDPVAAQKLGLTADQYAQRVQFLTAFEQQFPAIDDDMSDMLDRMDRNLENYEGVAALPPFPMFPWFFVLPGLMLAGGATVALIARHRGRSGRAAVIVVIVIGVGLIAAPAVFQMFTRAPGGSEMINDFRPLMTREKLTTIQGYFLTLGNGEADARNVALPAAGLPATDTPALTKFSADWPRINREMAPFVGVMADNLENFAAVDALPSFWLFPWFFVLPGVITVVLGGIALRGTRRTRSKGATPVPESSEPTKSLVSSQEAT